MTDPGTLVEQTRQFAAELDELAQATLPDAPAVVITDSGRRTSITFEGQTKKAGGAPLQAGGRTLAWLRVQMLCRLDHENRWLAVDSSSVWVVGNADSEPLIRFDYLRDPDTCPSSHVQVHAHRGEFSHVLALTGYPKPHAIRHLHVPTGGSRFRPGVEDVIQFLIDDCMFDGLPEWRKAVDKARAKFRRSQVRAAARALPKDAAEALIDKGYQVIPPEGGHPADKPDALTGW